MPRSTRAVLAICCALSPPVLAQMVNPQGSPAPGATSAATQPGTPTPSTETPRLYSYQAGRPTLTLADGNFTVQPVVRLDLDAGTFWDQRRDAAGRPQRFLDSAIPGVPDHGLNVRRARIGLQGTVLRDFTYNFTWDFAPTQGPGRQIDPVKNSRVFELQAGWNFRPWGTLRVGAFTLAHTLEFATSSFESLLLEKPAIINIATSLASGDTRVAGGIEARGDRWFAASYVTGGSLATLHDANQRGLVGRVAGLPFNDDRFRILVGMNAAAQFHPGTSPGNQTVRLRDYPELRLEPTRLLDSRSINADNAYAYGPEISGLVGPFYVAAEYQRVQVDGYRGAADRGFDGWYAAASLPLTGGTRRYDRTRAVWTRPRFEPFNLASGHYGFAEAVVRWSQASLNDGSVRGGRQGIFSAGVNWYPVAQIRTSIMYSTGTVRLDGPDRPFQALGFRLAFNL